MVIEFLSRFIAAKKSGHWPFTVIFGFSRLWEILLGHLRLLLLFQVRYDYNDHLLVLGFISAMFMLTCEGCCTTNFGSPADTR